MDVTVCWSEVTIEAVTCDVTLAGPTLWPANIPLCIRATTAFPPKPLQDARLSCPDLFITHLIHKCVLMTELKEIKTIKESKGKPLMPKPLPFSNVTRASCSLYYTKGIFYSDTLPGRKGQPVIYLQLYLDYRIRSQFSGLSSPSV